MQSRGRTPAHGTGAESGSEARFRLELGAALLSLVIGVQLLLSSGWIH